MDSVSAKTASKSASRPLVSREAENREGGQQDLRHERDGIFGHEGRFPSKSAVTRRSGAVVCGGEAAVAGPSDQSGTRAAPLDPLLGPFARGLGPTPVLPLLPGSPAIDRGNDAECPVDDQRLMPRPVDGDGDGFAVCDIGAVEQD